MRWLLRKVLTRKGDLLLREIGDEGGWYGGWLLRILVVKEAGF